MSKLKNRIVGVIGISSKMANWNADFTGHPKSTSDGDIFGSDKALKYAIKRYWENEGEKVLYIRSYKIEEKGNKTEKHKLQPKSLKERYEEIFESELDTKTPSEEVLKNLFSAIDVMNFGATFAEEKQNIGITGAIQINQGFNKYEFSTPEVQSILSPFRNAKKAEADATSLGKKITSNEAHYFYSFTVNPQHYDQYTKLIDGFEGYTQEAYEKYKDAVLVCATALNTNSKIGCENEFGMFIEFKEGEHTYLPNLDQYISFEKGEERNIIDLTKVEEILKDVEDHIQGHIEVYYNPYSTTINATEANRFLFKNIFTRQSMDIDGEA